MLPHDTVPLTKPQSGVPDDAQSLTAAIVIYIDAKTQKIEVASVDHERMVAWR
jgi:hypothetical protein